MTFLNREDAGRRIARLLTKYQGGDTLVLGLPRGGVVVAYEVASALKAPLDVWIVRKIGAPFQPELGMGAIAEGGGMYLDPHLIQLVGVTEDELAEVVRMEAAEMERRIRRFRGDRPRPDVKGRTVIMVDDGIATGGTVRAAVHSIRRLDPGRLVLAVPVAAVESLDSLGPEVDEVVCPVPAEDLIAVGAWYENFQQTSDEEVSALLEANRQELGEERLEAHEHDPASA